MVERIETFLFDIVGLLVPGIVAILTFLLSFAITVDWNIYTQVIEPEKFYINSIFSDLIFKTCRFDWGQNQLLCGVILFILLCYLFGHIAKIFSKIFYDVGILFFDNFLIKLLIYLGNKIGIKKLNILNNFVSKNLAMIFEFKVPSYSSKFEKYYLKTIDMVRTQLGIELNDWYSLYKLAQVSLRKEEIKTLTNRYLSKYNLYRSLSFIFLLDIIFMLQLFKKGWVNIEIFPYYLFLISISWLTFHEKYKRYWVLCGNDALVSFFYFLVTKNDNGEV